MRTDANKIAMELVRLISDAAHDFDCEVEGSLVRVVAKRGAPPKLPGQAGAAPPSVELSCAWAGGSVELRLSADWHREDTIVALKIALARNGAQLLWIGLPKSLRDHADGVEVQVPASLRPARRKGDASVGAMAEAVWRAFERSGLPLWQVGRSSALAFTVTLPLGLSPAAGEVFERLIKIALLKLPAFAREDGLIEGRPPYQVPPAEPSTFGDTASDGKFAGVGPLPGGVREQKRTVDEVLERVSKGCTRDELEDHFRTRYQVTGKQALTNYIGLLSKMELIRLDGIRIELGENGRTYLQGRRPEALFAVLNQTFSGFLEMLVIAKVRGRFGDQASVDRFKQLLDVDWESSNQVNMRRNWLLSLGAFERAEGEDSVTDFGLQLLAEHSTASERIAERLELETDEPPSHRDEPDEVAQVALVPSWDAELELSAEAIARHATLKLAPELLDRAAVALCAGKHLLLIGPPGTGKTELATALGAAARSEGYCLGMHTATASADWTTFDTVGGYALQKDGSLRFRPGALLRALEQKKWLLVDELNRADVDRAFGELMTVLSGGVTDTSYENDRGQQIRIGGDRAATHFVPPSFRVIATMNTWDKTSLFRLSFAVQRRFAIINVGCPPPADYAALLTSVATEPGPGQPLPAQRAAQIATLFSPGGLLRLREIGPAIALDVVRYVRRREKQGSGLAEAVGMFVLAQLEGLSNEEAKAAWKATSAALEGWTVSANLAELRQRFVDLFPDAGID